jgi:hypothetical protein
MMSSPGVTVSWRMRAATPASFASGRSLKTSNTTSRPNSTPNSAVEASRARAPLVESMNPSSVGATRKNMIEAVDPCPRSGYLRPKRSATTAISSPVTTWH